MRAVLDREGSLKYYELTLDLGGVTIDVGFDAHGGIGEMERQVRAQELPPTLARLVRKLKKGAKPVLIELHERWGKKTGGGFKRLLSPSVFYELKYGGEDGEGVVWEPESKLAPSIARAIRQVFPQGVVVGTALRRMGKLEVYEVMVVRRTLLFRAVVERGGRIIETTRWKELSEVPHFVLSRVKKFCTDCEILTVTERRVFGKIDGRRVIRQHPPIVFYIVRLRKDKERTVLTIDERGTIRSEGSGDVR